ncbi:hypothetical protein [Phormidium tenue]|uniref:Uncharacterized protein n=1 Tax=Phormidium tenue FACHB-1050 TaxID=2692857 RepID=A0ABR8CD44_9CYAN|nr:hypothetical protein [Phormidium tenue]MBD2318702.1 hypothetical protein [Phormidium tenue FACHB-1050]
MPFIGFCAGMLMIGLAAGLVSGLEIAHLPVAASIWTLTPIVIIRTILLNSTLGVAFGYLYWYWGLEYAILSHFLAGLVLHGIGGS